MERRVSTQELEKAFDAIAKCSDRINSVAHRLKESIITHSGAVYKPTLDFVDDIVTLVDDCLDTIRQLHDAN